MSNRAQAGGRLTPWLERAPAPVFAAYAIVAAFSTYFCMYAFRKPFAAAKFEGEFFLGTTVALKTAIVISQIIGYALSKYIGIKVCSEVSPARRAATLLTLIVWAELALVNRIRTTKAFQDNAKQQLRELIKQNFNHPSICFWSQASNSPPVSAWTSNSITRCPTPQSSAHWPR